MIYNNIIYNHTRYICMYILYFNYLNAEYIHLNSRDSFHFLWYSLLVFFVFMYLCLLSNDAYNHNLFL